MKSTKVARLVVFCLLAGNLYGMNSRDPGVKKHPTSFGTPTGTMYLYSCMALQLAKACKKDFTSSIIFSYAKIQQHLFDKGFDYDALYTKCKTKINPNATAAPTINDEDEVSTIIKKYYNHFYKEYINKEEVVKVVFETLRELAIDKTPTVFIEFKDICSNALNIFGLAPETVPINNKTEYHIKCHALQASCAYCFARTISLNLNYTIIQTAFKSGMATWSETCEHPLHSEKVCKKINRSYINSLGNPMITLRTRNILCPEMCNAVTIKENFYKLVAEAIAHTILKKMALELHGAHEKLCEALEDCFISPISYTRQINTHIVVGVHEKDHMIVMGANF